MFISAVGRGHNSVCATDVSDVCVCLNCMTCVCMNSICYREVQHISYLRSKLLNATMGSLLSIKWGIGREKAKTTIKNTTQYNVRSALLPLTRRYRTDLVSQRLRRLNTRFYTDTMFAKVGTSLRGNTCAQVFTDGNRAVFVYPMKSKSEAGNQLLDLIQQVGVPNELHRDGAPEMGGDTKFNRICREYKIRSTFTEPYSPWQNRC